MDTRPVLGAAADARPPTVSVLLAQLDKQAALNRAAITAPAFVFDLAVIAHSLSRLHKTDATAHDLRSHIADHADDETKTRPTPRQRTQQA